MNFPFYGWPLRSLENTGRMTCIPQRIKLNMKGNYIASYRLPSLVPIEFPLKTMPKRKLNRHVKITAILQMDPDL